MGACLILQPKNATVHTFSVATERQQGVRSVVKLNDSITSSARERPRHQLRTSAISGELASTLARAKQVALDGAWVRLPGHEVRLTAAEEALWRHIRPLIANKERFRPPRVRDIAGMIGRDETDIRRLFKLLGRLGKVDEVAHDHFFLRGTVAEMVETAADLAAKAATEQFTAAEFRDRLDNGRKVAIQILEFFDRHGVTLRRGDLRRINKHRLDLFRRPADQQPPKPDSGRESSPVGRPDFKSGRGREPVFGGFDPHSLPPTSRRVK